MYLVLLKAFFNSDSQQHNQETRNKPQINFSNLHIVELLQNSTLNLLYIIPESNRTLLGLIGYRKKIRGVLPEGETLTAVAHDI